MTRIVVAVVGDSISAGSPLWDPDPSVRAHIGTAADERSQWQWWANAHDPRLEFRTRAAYGKRTDEIAAFVEDVASGADVLVVQGGINDVAQRRSVEDAARNLAGIVEHGRRLGPKVALADVLPWPNGDDRAAREIGRLNELVHAIDGVTQLPFHDALTALEGWSDDGAHPSVEGHRLLGELAARVVSEM
ncbi:MAG TPA: SGNH/GDSL hydrolase family protein [Gaiellaceae bacterium]|nr:SGNH/GDSL hydrolase family protein [Gaiellaceae bacterium]